MRAVTGTPELGITGVDLASFVPAGFGAMRNAVQEKRSKPRAREPETDPLSATHHATASARTIAQTGIKVLGKLRNMGRGPTGWF